MDDLVMGVPDEVVAHQFKKALQPTAFGVAEYLVEIEAKRLSEATIKKARRFLGL